MNTRLWILLPVLLLLSAIPLAAQETLIVAQDGSAPAFACAGEDCERLAWLPDGAGVSVIAEVEGREIEGSALWYEVLLDCPCFDFDHRLLEDAPAMPVSPEGHWTLWQPRWSPDGSRFAATADTDLYVWDPAGGALLTQKSYAPFTLLPPSWSPDGAQMLVTGLDQERQNSLLLLLDASGHSSHVLSDQGSLPAGVAWSPDGSRIAVVGEELRIWDAQQRQSLLAIETLAIGFHWSPDSKRIVTINLHGEAPRVRDASTGELLFSLDEQSVGDFPLVDWSPDGARIVTYDVIAGAIHVWDASDGSHLASLAEGDSGYILDADWSPDSGHILYTLTANLSGRIKRWSGNGQDPPHTLFDSDQGILGLSLSPDGNFLVAGIEGEVRILDGSEGRLLANLRRPDADAQQWFSGHVDWSPDGARIAAAGTQYVERSQVGWRNSVGHIWDLTLIPEGPTRAFIHSSHVGDAADER